MAEDRAQMPGARMENVARRRSVAVCAGAPVVALAAGGKSSNLQRLVTRRVLTT